MKTQRRSRWPYCRCRGGRDRPLHAHFPTKEAVSLDVVAAGVACEGCPPLPDSMKRDEAAGGRYFVCLVCFDAKKLDKTKLIDAAEVQGTIPMWQWIGDGGALTFSY